MTKMESSEVAAEQAYCQIPLAAIWPSKTNPRGRMDKEALAELADSVSRHGVLQPVLVRPLAGGADGKTHEIVAGHRRYEAAKAAKLENIPAIVRELTDVQVLEVQLIENLQRADLHPLEEAEGYQQLHKKHGYAVEDLAVKVGKSKAYVYGRLKLCELPPAAKKAFGESQVSASIALLVARIPNEKLADQAMREILGRGQYGSGEPLSYRRASEHVRQNYMTALSGAPWKKDDAELYPEAGACTVCPKRTGNQRELFGDVGSADVCTDPGCFQKKLEAWKARRLADAEVAGQTVLSGKAAKKALYGSDHIQLDEACYELGGKLRGKTWKQVLGKDLPAPVLIEADANHARNGRGTGLIEAVPRAAALKALKEKYPEAAKANQRPMSDGERDRVRKAKWKMQVHDAAITELVQRAEAAKTDAGFLRLLGLSMVNHWWSETQKYVLHRRGLEKKPTAGFSRGDTQLVKLVRELPEKELRGLLVELVAAPLGTYGWQSGWMEGLAIASKSLGLDLRKVEARARKEQAAKKKPKKPSAEKKGRKA